MKYLGYHTLIDIWSKLSENQKSALVSGNFDQLTGNDVNDVSNKGLLAISRKLSPTQINLMKSYYSNQIDFDHCSQNRRQRIACHLMRMDEYGYDSTKVYVDDNIVEYNELNVPKIIKGLRGWRLVRRFGDICWYTGEECIVDIDGRKAWSVSEEHLIPKARGGRRMRGNTVVVANFVNGKLENAPLHVKLHVRSELIDMRQSLTNLEPHQKVSEYKAAISRVLNLYKVKGHLPWVTVPVDLRRHIRPMLIKHLEFEKEFIDRFIGKKHNIRTLLEGMTDGMETWQFTPA